MDSVLQSQGKQFYSKAAKEAALGDLCPQTILELSGDPETPLHFHKDTPNTLQKRWNYTPLWEPVNIAMDGGSYQMKKYAFLCY